MMWCVTWCCVWSQPHTQPQPQPQPQPLPRLISNSNASHSPSLSSALVPASANPWPSVIPAPIASRRLQPQPQPQPQPPQSWSQCQSNARGVRGCGGSCATLELCHCTSVITDGRAQLFPNDPFTTVYARQAAEREKARGVIVLAIGVGSGIDAEELEAMASEPKAKHWTTMGSFDSLSQLSEAMSGSCVPEIPDSWGVFVCVCVCVCYFLSVYFFSKGPCLPFC